MAEENFTQEQVNEAIEDAKTEWINNELDPIVAERDNLLQYKPKELSEEEKQFKQQQQDFFNQKVDFQLEKNGLTQFKDIIKVDNEEELNTVVDSLTQIVKQVKLDSGYVPEEHLKESEYEKYSKARDVQGMIGVKLSKLFK
ncbi:hypothetical protein [Oceanobacillus sp. J11TS1]|uniref:hypothetical protein n=1 Tax=Oceanobacillus sp. J11TS1 TaxID=2807191 RepID=UPI001AFF2584|nr:hypothetical protein [Oceanobacillus sp. J11TS1]GIO22487.1 hypothetical protein J11TS1_10680 [Oceanobacillus sp. J11TS1]